MLNHLREFILKKQPLSVGSEVWNHTRSEQNQERLLMPGRASETPVIDEKGREDFREPRAKSFSKEHPEVGHKPLQAAAVSSRGCFLSRSSSVWIKPCLVQDD